MSNLLLSSYIKLPKDDITLNNWRKISTLCKPLQKLGISFFNLLEVYSNGSIVDLNNRTDLTEYFYYKSNAYLKFLPIVKPNIFNSGIFLDLSIPNQDLFTLQKELFDIDHIIFFVKKSQNFKTYWQFGSTVENISVVNIYLNNLKLLKSFITLFENQASSLLYLARLNKYRLEISNAINEDYLYPYPKKVINNIAEFYASNRSIFPLSARELECLKYYIDGYSGKQISALLEISTRTVESYFANIKMKLNCKKLSQVIAKAIILGYV